MPPLRRSRTAVARVSTYRGVTDGREQLRGWRLRDYDQLIAKLARSRESQGISQARLAAEAHYGSDVGVHYVLSGKRDAPGRRLFDLADALGYDLALVPREDAP